MAFKLSLSLLFCVIFFISVVPNVDSASPHQAPSPSVDCSSLVLNMADCLTFVTNGSTVSKPEGSCCSGLKTVLKADSECLCEAFKSSAQLGVVLNVSKALSLPEACRVSAPSLSTCGLSLAPGAAPVQSPTSAAAAGAPTAVRAASEQAPAPAPSSSGSSMLAISAGSLVVSLVVASFSSF